MSNTPLVEKEDPKIKMLGQLSTLATNMIVEKSNGTKDTQEILEKMRGKMECLINIHISESNP